MNLLFKKYIKMIVFSEGRFEDALAKNPELEKEIEKLKETDPAGNLKYLNWQIKQLKRGEPIDEIISLTKTFYNKGKRLEKKDIYAYKTLGELRGAFEEIPDKIKSQELTDVKGDAQKIFENEDVLVVYPETKSASCFYGRGTKWCVSATKTENYFESYAGENTFLYFVIDKTKTQDHPMHKFAYAIKGDEQRFGEKFASEFFNSKDEQITEFDVADSIGTFNSRKIRKVIAKHLTKTKETKEFKLQKIVDYIRFNEIDKDEQIEFFNMGNEKINQELAVVENLDPNIIDKLLETRDSHTLVNLSSNRVLIDNSNLVTKLLDVVSDIKDLKSFKKSSILKNIIKNINRGIFPLNFYGRPRAIKRESGFYRKTYEKYKPIIDKTEKELEKLKPSFRGSVKIEIKKFIKNMKTGMEFYDE